MKWNKNIGWKTLLIFIPLLLTTVVPSTAAGCFTDLASEHWAFDHVSRLSRDGILSGYPDGTFRAGNAVSTGEFIKMAVVAGDVKDEADESPDSRSAPSEVSSSASQHWAKPFYDAGLSAELFTGFDIGPLALDHPITRDKMALIVNALLGDRLVAEERSYSEWLNEIRDVDSRTAYEYSIVRAYATGILTGYPDGTFRPKGVLSRGEAAVVFSKMADFLSGPLREDDGAEGTTEPKDENPATAEPKHEKDPFVVIGSVMTSEPPETLTFTMQSYDDFSEETIAELGFLLKQYLPAQATAMENTFVEFAAKPAGPGRQGIRKQYFGEFPVLMERVNTTLRIFVFPAGFTNRTWDTVPGQINEAFF